MTLRKACEADLVEICKLADEINQEHFSHAPRHFSKPKGEGEDRWFWKAEFEKENGLHLVYEEANQVVGFVIAKIINTSNLPFLVPMKKCMIGTIVVSGQHRRKGIGRQLIAGMIKIAKDQGAADLALDVMNFNQGAREFYRALGFAPSHERLCKDLTL